MFNENCSIYLVTDSSAIGNRDFYDCVEEALKAGVEIVQLREKNCGGNEFVEKAKKLRALTTTYGATFIVNDRVDVAMLVGADGVHVGQKDMSAPDVRKLIGQNMILGVSAKNVEEALKAKEEGADYIGVGAMFPTNSKEDADAVSFEELTKIVNAVSIPIVVIGGIHQNNVHKFQPYPIHSIAVISAILGAENIQKAVSTLRAKLHVKSS